MLYFYKELKKKLKSDYNIKKALDEKKYFKIEKGIYSDIEKVNPIEVIKKKYPEAIFASESAFYFYNLTDVIPDVFYLATKRNFTRITDRNIKQIFIQNDLFSIGKKEMKIEDVVVSIYDEERILVELIRKKNSVPFDYYKEIINNYRKIVDRLDIYKLQKYISLYKNDTSIYDTLMREVF